MYTHVSNVALRQYPFACSCFHFDKEKPVKLPAFFLLFATMLFCSACTTAPDARVAPEARFDSAYIIAVERAAASNPHGMDVIWVQPPSAKQQPAEDEVPPED